MCKTIFENEMRISAIDSIELDIFLDFYRNIKQEKYHKNSFFSKLYPDGYLQSFVEYNGKKFYIRFYNWRDNPLRHLADYLYKEKA